VIVGLSLQLLVVQKTKFPTNYMHIPCKVMATRKRCGAKFGDWLRQGILSFGKVLKSSTILFIGMWILCHENHPQVYQYLRNRPHILKEVSV
jgi:hypothetical protein